MKEFYPHMAISEGDAPFVRKVDAQAKIAARDTRISVLEQALDKSEAALVERDQRLTELEADRRVLQSTGEHPAPCARHCEANAFRIELRNKDARISQLEATQQNGHAALTAQIAENAELKFKLANHAARLGTALKTRRELLGKLAERDARIAELEACVRERDEHLGLLQEELDTWIHTNAIDVLQRRIVELEAEAGVDRALLALAEARLNREVLKTKGGV